MSFLKSILGKGSSKGEAPQTARLGNVDPLCPYCSQKLDVKPARKKKCPHCGNYIYVKTRVEDREKVLVTEAQAKAIDEQWTAYHAAQSESPEERRALEEHKRALAARLGREPSDRDAKWSLFNQQRMNHAARLDWGLYRNATLDMAEFLLREGNKKQALRTYLEVCYLDLNGPNNMGGITDRSVLKEFPPFSPDSGLLGPGLIHEIAEIAEELSFDRDMVFKVFEHIAQPVHQNLKLPVAPDTAWKKIAAAVFK